MFILIYIIFVTVTECFSSYVIISSKSDNVTFKYFDGVGISVKLIEDVPQIFYIRKVQYPLLMQINGESDLHECKLDEVCSMIHDRFWVSKLTERLCRCPNGHECPWQWTKQLGNTSISLNNKSRMELCKPISKPICTGKEEAIEVYGKSDRNNSYLIPHNATINCICPESHYWRLQKYIYGENNDITQTFKCVKKRMCGSYEFCGHIRCDLYSTYYKCTCPENHLCIFKDRHEENVQELFYSGPAFNGYCLPYKSV